MSTIESDEIVVDPAVRSRNVRLGLVLGGIALGVVVTFMVVFTQRGLPKDPAEWKRIQRLESARRLEAETIGDGSGPSRVTPTDADQAAAARPNNSQPKDER